MKTKFCLLAGAALPIALLATAASAQTGSGPSHPPVFQYIDAHGVELQTGTLGLVLGNVSIGPGGPGSLSFNLLSDNSSLRQSADVYGYVDGYATSPSSSSYSVVLGGDRETFTLSGSLGTGAFAQDQGRPSTLIYNASNNQFTYTDESGVVSVFSYQLSSTNPASDTAKIISRTYPAGETLNYYYAYHPYTVAGSTINLYEVQAVTSSLGYQLRLGYTLVSGTQSLSSVVAFNMANETCDPAAASCTLTGTWPSLTIDRAAGTVTDSLSRVTHMSVTSSAETITLPSGRVVTYGGALQPDGSLKVTSYNDGKGTWQYQYPLSPAFVTLVFNPDSTIPHTYAWNTTNGQISTDTPDPTGPLETDYGYDSAGRTTSIKRVNRNTSLSMGETDFVYDTHGRLTHQTSVAAAGASIDLQADYPDPSTCTNPKYCNKPYATRDGNLKQTDYTYDPNSGNVATITQPAPTGTTPRPETVYTYTTQAANFRNGSGTLISGAPAYRLTTTTQCATSTTCSGTVNEIKTTIAYDPNQAILPTATAVGAGNGVFTATKTLSYYPTGDVKTADGPLSGAVDTTRYYYDTMRQSTGVIGPRPDSTHAYRAARTTYNGEGQPTLTEVGTATGQGDSDMATFASLQQQATSYDGQGRVQTQALKAGGTTFQLTQSEYTGAGALHCEAVRMVVTSLPSSACVQSSPISATFGPDLITQYAYDTLFRVTSITQGVGTTSSQTVLTNTYGPNGELATVADAKGNLTTYEYDGFYRRTKIRFPNPSGGGSSASDAEQFTYDAESNVLQHTMRNNSYITFVYDGLNRVKSRTPSVTGTNPTSTFTYDLLGRPTQAVASTTAHTVTDNFTYSFNAQGPMATDDSLLDGVSASKKTKQFDAAGRRTQLSWADGFAFSYAYDAQDEMTSITDSAGTVTEAFTYDNLGRRVTRTAGNGTSATYTYDGASNLSSLALSGSSPVTIAMGSYSPAGQIMSRSITNASYAWNQAANANVPYTTDGQNRYATIAGVTQGYDPKSNLNSSPGFTASYGIENTMTSMTTTSPARTVNLIYDAYGRLIYDSVSGRFDYDGDQLVTELSATSTITSRYAFGPGTDEPLVWYPTSGTGSRRYFDADERGSIVRVANAAGTVLNINTYDEYGLPGTTNSGTTAGRFQYTGQAYMPELGLYNFKARMYSPSLGRFLQPDPLGLEAGPNIYNYVNADPINSTDPSGMAGPPGASSGGATDGESCNLCEILVSASYQQMLWKAQSNYTGLVNLWANYAVPNFDAADEVVITARRPKITGLSPDCGSESGGKIAKYAGDVADIANTLATFSAIVGLEPLALGLEGTALLASGVKATAQWRSGDHTGALITGSSALLGSGAAHFVGAVGGKAISKAGERFQATGQGIVGYITGDVSEKSAHATFCPR